MANTIQKFLLNELDVRGAIVHLDTAWQTILERREYPHNIAELLGQATAATLLMSTNIKFNGQLMLQLQSPSNLSLLTVQNTNTYHFRALARYQEDNVLNSPQQSLTKLANDGLIAIIVEAEKGKEPYQGIVGIDSDVLSDCLETYFNQSEQLKTMLILRANEKQVAGILLQVMPSSKVNDDDWERLRHICETLNLSELETVDCETMIGRIFAEDDKVVYPCEPATFSCTCSDERTLAMLTSLETEELQDIVDAGESITIACDFCGQAYNHDVATISALLSHKKYPN